MGRVHWRHRALERRMRRTCYYADGRSLDQLSLPLTEAVVEYFAKNAPFDDLNFEYASDVSYAGAVSPSVLIVAMIYLERMRLNNKDHFQSSDPADLFTSALLCASKFLYDEAEADFVYNDEWALSCSRTLGDVNKSEVAFLNALQWNTMTREKEFYEMLRKLEVFIALEQCRRRGYASYSDLSVLVSSMTEIWNDVLLPALTVIGVATLTYTATVFGLYTCSLYASTMASARVSPLSSIASLSWLSTPAARLLPSPPPILSVAFEPSVVEKSARPAAKTEQTSEKTHCQPAVVENSSTEPTSYILPKATPANTSLCGVGMRSDEDVELPSPWTSWFFNTKAALAVWTI